MKKRWRVRFWIGGKPHLAAWRDWQWVVYIGSSLIPEKERFLSYKLAYRYFFKKGSRK
jgi:hypothetical protein